jgi:hypothetical protein
MGKERGEGGRRGSTAFGAAAMVEFEGFISRIHSIYEAHLHPSPPVRGGDVE